MKKRINILAALVCLLALSLAFTGCASTTPTDKPNLDGTWKNGAETFIINGKSFSLTSGKESITGTLSYTNTNISLVFGGTSFTSGYTLNGNTLTIARGDGLAGTWTK